MASAELQFNRQLCVAFLSTCIHWKSVQLCRGWRCDKSVSRTDVGIESCLRTSRRHVQFSAGRKWYEEKSTTIHGLPTICDPSARLHVLRRYVDTKAGKWRYRCSTPALCTTQAHRPKKFLV